MLAQFPYLTCPPHTLDWRPFTQLGLQCDPDPVFLPVTYYLRPSLVATLKRLVRP